MIILRLIEEIMQRNSDPAYTASACCIQTCSHCSPIHISTSFEQKRALKRIRRQERHWRPSGSDIRYRQRRVSAPCAALRIVDQSSSAQERLQQTQTQTTTSIHLSLERAAISARPVYLATTQEPLRPPCPTRKLPSTSNELTDDQAAAAVEHRFKERRETRNGRTLRKRLNHELDLGLSSVIQSLDAILMAADIVFFSCRLHKRVTWRWSCETDHGFATEFVGTTTPKYSEEHGVTAEIVLSTPLLQSGQYSSNLLLSAFLHELVHCYLFICCGSKAEEDGGHTPGFQRIVRLIQAWLGNPRLQLCSMRADLDNFLPDAENEEADEQCGFRAGEGEPVYFGAEEDPVYSDFSNSPMWMGNGEMWVEEAEEDFQADSARTWELPDPLVPAWEEVNWADTPRMAYVSRQELAGAFEGSFTMPILVE